MKQSRSVGDIDSLSPRYRSAIGGWLSGTQGGGRADRAVRSGLSRRAARRDETAHRKGAYMRLKTPLVALSSAGLLALAACGGSGGGSGASGDTPSNFNP